MSKYLPLARHLESLPADRWDARFSEVEEVLGFALPTSARRHRPWWANQGTAGHSQTSGWMSAGWLTENVSLEDERVSFVRNAAGITSPLPPASSAAPAGHGGRGLSISDAKLELSRYYNTAAENIEIIIRG